MKVPEGALLSTFKLSDESWLGFWDVPTEGIYRSINNASYVLDAQKYQQWDLGEPNGDIQG